MKKELPIGMPRITCALHHAYPLSILAISDDYLPWFYSHYIQMEFQTDEKQKFNFYRYPKYHMAVSPWLQTQIVHHNVIRKAYKKIVDFVIDAIDEDLYVQMDVDEFYIPNKALYHSRHYTRELLIYGYDAPNQTLTILGFDAKGNYTSSEVPFFNFEQAHINSISRNEQDCRVRMFKYLDNAYYEFELEVVLEQLQDYLYAVNTSKRFRSFSRVKNYAYGLATYRVIQNYLSFFAKNASDINRLIFHTLWEHKQCMQERLHFLEQHGFLSSSHALSMAYAGVKKETEKLRAMSFKYVLTKDAAILGRMIELINIIALEEEAILDRVCDALKTIIKARRRNNG